jgi:hypothetical protein
LNNLIISSDKTNENCEFKLKWNNFNIYWRNIIFIWNETLFCYISLNWYIINVENSIIYNIFGWLKKINRKLNIDNIIILTLRNNYLFWKIYKKMILFDNEIIILYWIKLIKDILNTLNEWMN